MAQSELLFDAAVGYSRGISGRQAIGRAIALAAFALLQAILVSLAYDPPYRDEAPNAFAGIIREYSTTAVHALIMVAATFIVINWPRRHDVLGMWRAAIAGRSTALWATLNVAVLIVALIASAFVSQSIEQYARYLAPYLTLLCVLGAAFLLTVAPLRFWRDLIAESWLSLLLSLCAAAFVLVFSRVAQAGWEPLAGATLALSHWLLTLYETNVFVNVATRELGVGNFIVNIAPQCSGYEGIGLVAAFLSLYLIVFRRDLAFPNALFLLPAGIVTIWLLNAVRIAVLVSVGAHVSPQLAIGGFHSQAGWIAFLLVTVGLMAISHTVPFFKRDRRAQTALAGPFRPAASSDVDAEKEDALPWLAPFIALMAASIIAGAFVPYDRWLYGLRVLGIGVALWVFWQFYWQRLNDKIDGIAILAGLAVGAAWIATDPIADDGRDLGDWLMSLSPVALAVWLIIRGIGTIVFVPIAEEFAFRGYLDNFIKTLRLGASPVAMTVLACVVSSALFGAIHQRWLAGALAGVVFALVMYRTGRISSAVLAHMAANAAIFAWALAVQQWSLI